VRRRVDRQAAVDGFGHFVQSRGSAPSPPVCTENQILQYWW
jgi:hypothetical protein